MTMLIVPYARCVRREVSAATVLVEILMHRRRGTADHEAGIEDAEDRRGPGETGGSDVIDRVCRHAFVVTAPIWLFDFNEQDEIFRRQLANFVWCRQCRIGLEVRVI